MRHLHALRLAALGAVVGALAVAAPAGAKTLHGTVVHKNASQHSFVVAARGGKLTEVSSRRAPALARIVNVKIRRAKGGTAVARRIRARGRAKHARLRGRVSFAGNHSFAISAGGASILVHDNGRLPAVGSTVTTDVTFGSGDELDVDDVQEHGDDNNGTTPSAMKIEGAIQAIDTTARTLTVLADDNGDDDSAGATTPTVTVHVPDAIDITQFAVGDEVELIVVPQADGTLELQSVDGNDDMGDDHGGKDEGQTGVGQGDDNGDQTDGSDNSGPGGDGGGDNSGSGSGSGGDGGGHGGD